MGCRGLAARYAALTVVACATGLLATGSAVAASAPSPLSLSAGCGAKSGLVCSEVEVPLDRTGQVAGTVGLHVEVLRSTSSVQRGAIFLVAGGPGQGSAQTFDLGRTLNAFIYRYLFPGYTLVAFDDRGTGSSGRLTCPSLARQSTDWNAAVAGCAAELGPQRAFYSTADHAADLEAVRQSLGFDRIAIEGVSYGTRLALAYASTYPQHVARLVLDSVLPPAEGDPFAGPVLRAMPATLARYCAGGSCADATRDYAGDVVAVANQLAASPLEGRVPRPNGTTAAESLDAVDFLGLVTDTDLNPGLAAELPAAVHAARSGDPQPLLHAYQLDSVESGPSSDQFSFELFLATVCADGPFAWRPETELADRASAVQAALAALPAGSFGPFGSWASGFANTALCAGWPSPAGDVGAPAGPLPDVPVLVLSGELDLRTPTAGAAAVNASFAHGHLLVVPGVGHSVLTADLTGCAQRGLRRWILSGTTPSACARAKPFLQPLAAFPPAGTKHLDPQHTRELATKTLREAEAVWLATAGMSGERATDAGVYGGSLVATEKAITLVHYGITRGVTVSGRIRLSSLGPPLVFTGVVHVTGAAAANGVLTLKHGTLSGRLGGRDVGP